MDDSPIFTRRELLKRVTIVGTAVAVPVRLITIERARPDVAALQGVSAAPAAFETLTAVERETLQAIVARLIPTDANGPGATEAQAAHYIDRALGGALASSREAYRVGLAALNGYTQASRKASFAQLPAADQDAVLMQLETDTASGFAGSGIFFNLVLAHTIQGTFGDPYYGGNAHFTGWDLIGYPGVRLTVAPADQRLDARPAPTPLGVRLRDVLEEEAGAGTTPCRGSRSCRLISAGPTSSSSALGLPGAWPPCRSRRPVWTLSASRPAPG
jgi:gluconate 2-dehydrogenase gamma chain